jgi:very-short-patch-repair endonuclease
MYKPSPHHATIIAAHASVMRRTLTPSEAILWEHLRGKRTGVAFRRQVVIGPYIVDFLAPSCRLIVEVDGKYHDRRVALDERRDRKLTRAGYRVLRLEAALVLRDLPEALAAVRAALSP